MESETIVILPAKMLRSDLIRILQKRNPHLHPSDVEAAVKEILDHMTESLTNGDRIEIRGFGSFSLRHLPPRQSRNPKTGERLMLDDQYRVHFKPGLELRERVDASS